ncbi:MAG: hypothetical protein AAFQ67_05160 [Pseudomonadota bacterium]
MTNTDIIARARAEVEQAQTTIRSLTGLDFDDSDALKNIVNGVNSINMGLNALASKYAANPEEVAV